jgi:hypothetical protein
MVNEPCENKWPNRVQIFACCFNDKHLRGGWSSRAGDPEPNSLFGSFFSSLRSSCTVSSQIEYAWVCHPDDLSGDDGADRREGPKSRRT